MGLLGRANSIFGVSLFDRIQKRFEIRRAGVEDFIEIDCRRARHMLVKQAALVVCLNLAEIHIICHFAFESFNVKRNALGVARQLAVLKGGLVSKQFVVHLPEFLLRARSLSGFRSPQRVRMCANSWEVTKGKAQIVTKNFLHLLDDRINTSAVDALEVPVLKKSNGRSFRARGMILPSYPIFESDYFRSTHISRLSHRLRILHRFKLTVGNYTDF